MSISSRSAVRPAPSWRHAGASLRSRRPPNRLLTDLGVEVIAHRLRTLGHPLRLRILRSLDGRHATAEQLAEELGASSAAVAAHLRLLSGCGVVCRTDDSGLGGVCAG